ncbi:hypothetical protein MYAM1_000756 [Malassezia yamatoensis]|uniref:Shq1 C-terminal domain-containing protein n=1 Tax=Malassezia yamatoensis TaxID=253288 RepID=A0AAJ6CGA3_9BASI|nr:hypothetical protein MYAM1_000756 [Malassezia yamatoensis]
MDPVYLPLKFPETVHGLELEISLKQYITTREYTYDHDKRSLEVRLQKTIPGKEFQGLEALCPQFLSESETQAFERDAMQEMHKKESSNKLCTENSAEKFSNLGSDSHPVGLLRRPLQSTAYEALVATGRVPYLDIVDPWNYSFTKRWDKMLQIECEKWDEGMFLDGTVDFDDQITEYLQYTYTYASSHPDIVPVSGSPADSDRALPLLAQILYAYLYEMRMSVNDPTPESAWTIVKLSRSLSCWADPEDNLDLCQTLCGSFRRTLIYPLHRSIAVCEKVCRDASDLLACSPRDRILHALHNLDGWFALAPTGTGLSEQASIILSLLYDLWIAPLSQWVAHTATESNFDHLRHVFDSVQFNPELLTSIGSPGNWDLIALKAAAEEARATGEGQWV